MPERKIVCRDLTDEVDEVAKLASEVELKQSMIVLPASVHDAIHYMW